MLLILESQFYVVSVNFRNYLYVLICLHTIIVNITEFRQVSVGTNTLGTPHFSTNPFTYECRNSTRHKTFGAHAAPFPLSRYWLQIGLETVSLTTGWATKKQSAFSLNLYLAIILISVFMLCYVGGPRKSSPGP
jgi:hypothetical protein